MEQYESYDSKLKLPFLMVLAGPTSSGKTVFLTELLKNTNLKFDKQLDNIIYCYAEYLPETFKILTRIFGTKIRYIKGLNFDIESFNPARNNFLIIDDLIQDSISSK